MTEYDPAEIIKRREAVLDTRIRELDKEAYDALSAKINVPARLAELRARMAETGEDSGVR